MLSDEVTRHLEPIMMYRAAGWSFQKRAAIEIDALQASLVTAALAVPRLLDEPDDEFHRRRCRVSNTLCEVSGRWSLKWAMRVTTWYEHLKRNTGGVLWSGLLESTRNASWLQVRRSTFAPANPRRLNPWTSLGGRTDTRLHRGGPPMRYEAGVLDAQELIEAKRKESLVAPLLKKFDRRAAKLARNAGTNSFLRTVGPRALPPRLDVT
jgi:hypothetical protein